MSAWQPAVMAAAGAGVGVGIWLLAAGPLRGSGTAGVAGDGLRRRARVFLAGPGGVRMVLSVAAGLVVLVSTRWVPVAAAVVLVGVAWPTLFGALSEQRVAVARLEALASWVEALRDTIATSRGLPEAIPAAARAHADGALGPALTAAASRMAAREPIEPVLRALADDIDDPAGDQVVATLILSARDQGPALTKVLTGLAMVTRREVEARRRVASDRRSTRRAVQVVLAVVAAMVVAMATIGRDYGAAYASGVGQLMLLVEMGLFVGALWWMRRLSAFVVPARFLTAGHDVAPGARPASSGWGGGSR